MSLEHKQGESVEVAFAHPDTEEIQNTIVASFGNKNVADWAEILDGIKSRLQYPSLNIQVSEALNGLIVNKGIFISSLIHADDLNRTMVELSFLETKNLQAGDVQSVKDVIFGSFKDGKDVLITRQFQDDAFKALAFLREASSASRLMFGAALTELIGEKKVAIVSMPDPFGSLIVRKT